MHNSDKYIIDNDTLYVKVIKLSDSQIQVNIISKNKDDEMDTHDLELPKNLDMLANIDALLGEKQTQNQLEKLTDKYIEKPKPKKKSSLLVGR